MRYGQLLPAVAVTLAAVVTLAGCETGSEAETESDGGNGTPTDPAAPTPTPSDDGTDGGTDGGTDDGVDGEAPEQLTDSRWIPDHVTVDGTDYPRPPGLTLVHLRMPDAERFHNGFCRYGSDVTAGSDALLVAEVVSSEMDCHKDGGAFEENFLEVFQGRLTYTLDDEDGPGMNSPATLTLTNPDVGTITLTEDVPFPLPTT